MGAHPDSPLITQLDDIVTWNNTTTRSIGLAGQCRHRTVRQQVIVAQLPFAH
jgi:hypothetical protein